MYGSTPGENLILGPYFVTKLFTICSLIWMLSLSKFKTTPCSFCTTFITFAFFASIFILAISIKFSTSTGIVPYLSIISSMTSSISLLSLHNAISW